MEIMDIIYSLGISKILTAIFWIVFDSFFLFLAFISLIPMIKYIIKRHIYKKCTTKTSVQCIHTRKKKRTLDMMFYSDISDINGEPRYFRKKAILSKETEEFMSFEIGLAYYRKLFCGKYVLYIPGIDDKNLIKQKKKANISICVGILSIFTIIISFYLFRNDMVNDSKNIIFEILSNIFP